MRYLIDMIFTDPKSWIISGIIGIITYYLVKLYIRVLSYPPGPIPLPLLGNILLLRGLKYNPAFELIKLHHKYGPIMTFWIGPKPFVFIFDLELGRDAFKRNEFSGRPWTSLGSILSNEKFTDVTFEDYGPRWESLRRVAHAAARKFATNEKLAHMISEIVDDSVKTMIEKEGINHPFVPFDYIYLLFHNILASSAFGKRYEMDDPEFLTIKYYKTDFGEEYANRVVLAEFMPILRPFYKHIFKEMEIGFEKLIDILCQKFNDHIKDYQNGIIRDFCDALINAKNDALNEGKESAQYLDNKSLAVTVSDLLFAGTDTTQYTFKWIILLMANYPEMQKKMREEIDSMIGDRIPVQNDRKYCHYINAFISETMRFRSVVPYGLFHKNSVVSKIGNYKIPSETSIFIHQHWILNDPKHWIKPEEFNPQRFLDSDGKYISQKPAAFIPFGTGRRMCLGEKLAIADVFLALVRFLQATHHLTVSLVDGPGSADLEPDAQGMAIFPPNQFKIIFQKINNGQRTLHNIIE